jgi:glycosyltransferase involved in cell wall biosynthesis
MNRTEKNARYREFGRNAGYTAADFLTYFTPTFNRAVRLKPLHDAFTRQTCRRFVWLVVNDGSTDNTREVMQELLDANELPILYVEKTNEGKHRAFETALELCRTAFFACADDDDLYDATSTRFFLDEWRRIDAENRSDIGAIRVLSRREDGSFVSSESIPPGKMGTRLDRDTLTRCHKDRITQENWTCYKTAALRQIDLFQKNYWLAEQNKFFNEAIWQGRFARKFRCRYVYVALRTYRTSSQEGISRGPKTRQAYLDRFIGYLMILNEQWDYLRFNPKYALRAILVVALVRHKLGIPFREFAAHLSVKRLLPLFWLLRPVCALVPLKTANDFPCGSAT